MAVIGKIAVNLTARTAELTKGLSRGMKKMKLFASQTKRVATRVAGIGTALMAVAAGGGAALMVKNSMAAIDATGKLSDELNISTERLVGFQHAADIAGTKQETLTKGMQRMIRRLGEAKLGYGEGVKGLEAMGLKADALVEKNPADAFEDIAEALTQMPDAASRAAAAYALFGRQGQELMNFLLLGKKGLKDMQAEAEKLGITFNRMDAAKVELANDSVLRLTETFKGMANTLTIQLVPFIDAAATKLVKLGTSGKGMGDKVVRAFEWILRSAARVSDWFNLLKSAANVMSAGVLTAVGRIQQGFGELVATFAEAADYVPGLGKVAAGAEKFAKDMIRTSEEYRDAAKLAADDAIQAYDAFSSGAAQRKVKAFFDELKNESEEKAKEVVKNINKINKAPALDMDKAAEKTGKAASFKQISLARTALSVRGFDPKTDQAPKATQIDKTNALLQKIATNTFKPVPVVG